MDLPILPLIAFVFGLIVLSKREVLNWAVALFLVGFGALGLARHYGLPIEPVETFLNEQLGQLR